MASEIGCGIWDLKKPPYSSDVSYPMSWIFNDIETKTREILSCGIVARNCPTLVWVGIPQVYKWVNSLALWKKKKEKKEKETLLVLRATALQLGTSFPYKAIETKNNK